MRQRRRVHRLLYLLLLPCLVAIGVLLLWPLGQVVVMSFHRLDNVRQLRGDRDWPWVGLDNYAQILSDPFFWTVLRNTVLFAVANVARPVSGILVVLSTIW
ncbi:sugar ABC transporter permease [Micromonospora craniellae]|uniref:sugar ABC transporter permease n=1 Tax=Micromonospora craniellae TaxID=2294034 RepID=UPI00168A8F8B|nr:sugar ABC transporter permease [Micromonospora craniellae]QOC90775.1 sugar ABC transporter permease [Micromonospora craniellae]